MTRKEKYKQLRVDLEKERYANVKNLEEYLYIVNHQKEVKKEKGCKH